MRQFYLDNNRWDAIFALYQIVILRLFNFDNNRWDANIAFNQCLHQIVIMRLFYFNNRLDAIIAL